MNEEALRNEQLSDSLIPGLVGVLKDRNLFHCSKRSKDGCQRQMWDPIWASLPYPTLGPVFVHINPWQTSPNSDLRLSEQYQEPPLASTHVCDAVDTLVSVQRAWLALKKTCALLRIRLGHPRHRRPGIGTRTCVCRL